MAWEGDWNVKSLLEGTNSREDGEFNKEITFIQVLRSFTSLFLKVLDF